MNRYCSGVFIFWLFWWWHPVRAGQTTPRCLRQRHSGRRSWNRAEGKQTAQTGSLLPQPVVVQVNDEQGTLSLEPWCTFRRPTELRLTTPTGLRIRAGKSQLMYHWEAWLGDIRSLRRQWISLRRKWE